MSGSAPAEEQARLAALRSYAVLDTPPEQVFDDLVQVAAHICATPVSLVSLIDADRQWFKARLGTEVTETPRDVSFCTHAIRGRDLFVVPDAHADERFAHSPLVTGEPQIRFYAGAPLVTPDGYALGTLCVIDRVPRELTAEQRDALESLARLAAAQLEARRTVAALEESREALADFFENAHDLIQSVGPDGRLMEVNAAWRETMGYSADEAGGLSIEDFIHPDSLPHCRAVLQEIALSGKGRQVEAVFVARDGREIDVEGAVNCRVEDGHAVYTRGIFRDVTRRKRAEAALAQSEAHARAEAARFAGVLRAAIKYSIIGTDEHGVITTFNEGAERMLGYAADEMIGVHTPELIHVPEELAARAQELGMEPGFGVFVASTRGDAPETREWTYVRKDGTRLPVELTVTAMTDPEGRSCGFIGIAWDISERKRAEAERERMLQAERDAARALAEQNVRLQELDAIKSELVSVVSHELRTPLTSIRGFVDILRGGEPGPLTEEQDHFLGIVDRNVDRLLRVVSDLLFVARVDSGTLILEVAPVDLAQVAREVIEAAQPLARNHAVTLELDAAGAPTIEGDGDRLNQLLDNLVANAVKFTPAGGRVRVRAGAENGTAVLEVADSGIGIPSEEQGHLFERFYRAASATERAIPGTGLGLTIVKAIVEAHRGEISVESEPGRGTTFHVELPVEHEDGRS